MTIDHNGLTLEIQFRQYPNGRTAIQLLSECQDEGYEGEMENYGVATRNCPDVDLKGNEVIVKNVNENAGILWALQDAEIVGNTISQVRAGYDILNVCELLVEPVNA